MGTSRIPQTRGGRRPGGDHGVQLVPGSAGQGLGPGQQARAAWPRHPSRCPLLRLACGSTADALRARQATERNHFLSLPRPASPSAARGQRERHCREVLASTRAGEWAGQGRRRGERGTDRHMRREPARGGSLPRQPWSSPLWNFRCRTHRTVRGARRSLDSHPRRPISRRS